MKLFRKHNIDFFKFCVCLVFFTTPIESVGISEESSAFSIVKLVVILLLFAWLFFSHRKIEINAITKLFLLLGGYWLLSCLWSIDIENSFLNFTFFYLPSLITMMIIGGAIQNKHDIRNILVAYLFGSIVLAVFCHLNRDITIANASFEAMERVTALGQDQNELSFLLVMGLVIALSGIQLAHNVIRKTILLACSIVLVYATLLTGSRTGAVMIVLVVALFIWNNKKYAIYTLPAILLLAPIIISQIPESSIERIINVGQNVRSGDFSERETIWEHGLTAFSKENVILGVGYQNFPTLLKIHFGVERASHNTYLSYLVTGGVFGITILLCIITKLFIYCKKIVHTTKNSYWYAYLVPLILVMLTLETQYRRWIFLIAIILYKSYKLSIYDNNNPKYKLPKIRNIKNKSSDKQLGALACSSQK